MSGKLADRPGATETVRHIEGLQVRSESAVAPSPSRLARLTPVRLIRHEVYASHAQTRSVDKVPSVPKRSSDPLGSRATLD